MTNSAGQGEHRKVHAPFAQPGQKIEPPPTELPPIEQFIDELPPIEDFLLAAPEAKRITVPPPVNDWAETSYYRPPTPSEPMAIPPVGRITAPGAESETDSEGWAAGEWQSYDWRGIASLGAQAPEAVEANAAWSSTNWDSASKRLSDLGGHPGGPPANEVAAALDEIARRIRSGELSLEKFHGTPPEAAIAAAFAALLRTRG